MTSQLLKPELNTCYFCCKWVAAKTDLFLCATCIAEKRQPHYSFALCGDCFEMHSKHHQKPEADLFDPEVLTDHIISHSNFTGVF